MSIDDACSLAYALSTTSAFGGELPLLIGKGRRGDWQSMDSTFLERIGGPLERSNTARLTFDRYGKIEFEEGSEIGASSTFYCLTTQLPTQSTEVAIGLRMKIAP